MHFKFPSAKSIIVSGDIHGDFNQLIFKLCVRLYSWKSNYRNDHEETTPMGEETTPMGEETTLMGEETTLK